MPIWGLDGIEDISFRMEQKSPSLSDVYESVLDLWVKITSPYDNGIIEIHALP